ITNTRERENSSSAATQIAAIHSWRCGSTPKRGKKASVSAPVREPSPIDARRKPNPCAPTWSTWSANSGIRVVRFMAKSEKTATAISSMPTTGSLRAYASPWASRTRRGCSSRCGTSAGKSRIDSERRHDEGCLREKQHVSFSEAVGDHTGKWAADQDGQELRRQDEPNEKSVVRQLQREPRKRHRLHPRADRRDDLAGEEEPVVAMTKRAEHACRRRGLERHQMR